MKKKEPHYPTADPETDGQEGKILSRQRPQDPSSDDPREQLDDRSLQISRWLQKMPDLEPPSSLVASVIGAIQPKQLPWTRRISLWARSPKSITFTPLRLAPVAIVLFGLLIMSGYSILRQKDFHSYPGQGESRIPVVFNLSTLEAHSVAVIGTFNGWKPGGYEMHFDREKEVWSLTVRLPAGRYEYAFLVDGQRFLPDPDALLYQEDGFGNENSVMILRANNENST